MYVCICVGRVENPDIGWVSKTVVYLDTIFVFQHVLITERNNMCKFCCYYCQRKKMVLVDRKILLLFFLIDTAY